MRRIGGIALTVTGFLACPCHLIITLPLLISLLASTALGSFLSRNISLVYIGAGIYFVVALALGAFLLLSPKRSKYRVDTACLTCAPVEAETHMQESSAQPVNLSDTRTRR
jgi:hypothetical protein